MTVMTMLWSAAVVSSGIVSVDVLHPLLSAELLQMW